MISPDIFTLPVKSCLSSEVSPNLVEPDSNTIDDDTNSVWNSCAVTLSVTTNEPVITWLALKWLLPVVAEAPSNVVTRVENEPESVFKLVILVEKELESVCKLFISPAIDWLAATKEPLISSASCADAEIKVLPVEPASTTVNLLSTEELSVFIVYCLLVNF